ncbi:hypothetical protein HY500_03340 [Candidatus Woesearchaeota archaeon]|nr:hypothetical protein [Candidatus Woesearchaeota archaeon]
MGSFDKIVEESKFIAIGIVVFILFIGIIESFKDSIESPTADATADNGISFLVKIVTFLSGQNPVEDYIIALVVAVGVAGGAGYYFYKKSNRMPYL